MSRLIADNYTLLQVMSRFGIKVGFGEKTVEEVCTDYGVHASTFLSVVNFMVYDEIPDYDHDAPVDMAELRSSLKSLISFLSQSHGYFLEFFLPSIRRKLLSGINFSSSDVAFLIIKFFDDYVNEVRTHMLYEDRKVFSYAEQLLEGKVDHDFSLTTYSDHHEEAGLKLDELKRIILKYCPDNADVNLLNDALYDIYRCENELMSHGEVENHLFVPLVRRVEKEVMKL